MSKVVHLRVTETQQRVPDRQTETLRDQSEPHLSRPAACTDLRSWGNCTVLTAITCTCNVRLRISSQLLLHALHDWKTRVAYAKA